MPEMIAPMDLMKNPLDLKKIYEICKKHDKQTGASGVTYKRLDQTECKEIEQVINALMGTIANAHFIPAFVELSLYDPSDKSGSSFFSVLMATNEKVVKCYKEKMEENVSGAKDRGPIIPDSSLHYSAYYYYDTEKEEEMKFTTVGKDCLLFAGRFEVSDDNERKDDNEKLKEKTRLFFEAVEVCFKATNATSAENGVPYNSAVLIPLFRPAASFRGNEETIYNGGGLFLYGHLEEGVNAEHVVLTLQSNITKALFRASHDQIRADEEESRRNNVVAASIHQVKTSLDTKVSEELDFVLKDFGDAIPEEARISIKAAKDFTDKTVTDFGNYLEGLKSLEKGGGTYFERFYEIANAVASEEKILVEVLTEESQFSKDAIISVPEIFLTFIITELFQNASKAFHSIGIMPEERKVRCQWARTTNENIAEVSILSIGTKMDEGNLKNYGKAPLPVSNPDDKRTGMGIFLLSKLLAQSNALRFSGEDYILPENLDEGFAVKMKFPVKQNN